MKAPESYGQVPLAKIKAAIKQIEEHYQDCPERIEDVNVTFEYLVGSFFPKIIDNINKSMNDAYMAGYLQGMKDAKGEENVNQGNN